MLGFGLSSAVFACSSFVEASRSCSKGFPRQILGVDVCGARYAGSASSSRSTRTTIVEGCSNSAQHRSQGQAQNIQRRLPECEVRAMPAAWPAEVMVRSGAPLAAKLSYQMRWNQEGAIKASVLAGTMCARHQQVSLNRVCDASTASRTHLARVITKQFPRTLHIKLELDLCVLI